MHSLRTNPVYLITIMIMLIQMPLIFSGYASGKKLAISATYWSEIHAPEKKNEVELAEATSARLFHEMELEAKGLSRSAFITALEGYAKLLENGTIKEKGLLTIADFSQASSKERLFVIDLSTEKVLIRSLVAHGRNSGLQYAKSFSNIPESNKSSLGFYLTMGTYEGSKGFSMHLQGLEKNINNNAYDRAIVMHGADYVSTSYAKSRGYIGRSLGCPAIPSTQTKKIINTIKNGTILFIYHPNTDYLKKSSLLNS